MDSDTIIIAQIVLLENTLTIEFLYYSVVRRKNIIGAKVREARKKKGVTQLELAAHLQLFGITIDRSGIAKLESDRRPASDIEVAAIARILKVSIPWLFEESNRLLDSFGTD